MYFAFIFLFILSTLHKADLRRISDLKYSLEQTQRLDHLRHFQDFLFSHLSHTLTCQVVLQAKPRNLSFESSSDLASPRGLVSAECCPSPCSSNPPPQTHPSNLCQSSFKMLY